MFVFSYCYSVEVCAAVKCNEWKHTDLIKSVLENQDGHRN